MSINAYLGVDAGSVTAEDGSFIDRYMTRTSGKPVAAVQACLNNLVKQARQTAAAVLQSEEVQAKRLDTFHTAAYKTKRSGMMLDFWADEEYRNIQSRSRKAFYQTEKGQLYIEARKLAHKKHSEITAVRKEIAEEFPMLYQVLEHIKNGTASEIEETYLLSYEQRCEEAMPGYHKIIGDEYHKILIEWG